MEKCTTAWTCRFKDCKNAIWNAGKNAIQCGKDKAARCMDYHFGNKCFLPGECIFKTAVGVWDASHDCADSLNPFKHVDCVRKYY